MALDADLLQHDRLELRMARQCLVEGGRADRVRINLGRLQHRAFAHDIVGHDQPARADQPDRLLEISRIAILVGVQEDHVEVACQRAHHIEALALNHAAG